MTELPKRPGREYDLMRAVAALAVVMIHTCALRWRPSMCSRQIGSF